MCESGWLYYPEEPRPLDSEARALDMAAFPLREDYLPRGRGNRKKRVLSALLLTRTCDFGQVMEPL